MHEVCTLRLKYARIFSFSRFILKPKINIKWTSIRNKECVLLNPEFKEYIAWIVVMFSYDFILIWNSFKCAKSTPLIQSNFGDQLVMSMCRVISCVVGRGCLLWPVCSLGKILLAFALLHSVLQGQICLLLQVSIDLLLWHSSPLWWKGHVFLVLALEVLVGLHRTIQLQLLQH